MCGSSASSAYGSGGSVMVASATVMGSSVQAAGQARVEPASREQADDDAGGERAADHRPGVLVDVAIGRIRGLARVLQRRGLAVGQRAAHLVDALLDALARAVDRLAG